jgi:ABC-type transport system involved in multi-copper enzyme maturation permease subunit
MKRIYAIAGNTFKETVRDRILYGLIVFILLVLPGSRLVIPLAIGQEVKIMKDFGFAVIALFGLLIAVVVGTSLVHKELDKRTIYVLVAKPVKRWELLVGKYFGLMATLVLAFAIMFATLAGTVLTLGGRLDWLLPLTVAGLFLQLAAITAVAIFFSTLASPALSAVFTICLYIVGTAADQLRLFADRMPSQLLKVTVKAVSYVVPNLHVCNFRTEAVYGLPVPAGKVLLMCGYIALYTALVLLVSSAILERKDLK